MKKNPGNPLQVGNVDPLAVGCDAPRSVLQECSSCPVFPFRSDTGCDASRSCVRTTYARHIERFFRTNPAWAEKFWRDRYFEVRAIVTRYLPPRLLKRWSRIRTKRSG